MGGRKEGRGPYQYKKALVILFIVFMSNVIGWMRWRGKLALLFDRIGVGGLRRIEQRILQFFALFFDTLMSQRRLFVMSYIATAAAFGTVIVTLVIGVFFIELGIGGISKEIR